MHAGEALHNLYALVVAVERKHGSSRQMFGALAIGYESCKVLSEFINVPLPDDTNLQARIEQFKLQPEISPSSASSPDPLHKTTPASSGEIAEALGLCDSILQDIDKVSNNEYSESVSSKAASMRDWIKSKNHVTDKMATALQNMRHGLDKWLHED